jgi:hypothetical protein
MKNQRALSRLSSWLESHKRELLKLWEFEESIERLELIDCAVRRRTVWIREWKAENTSLASWFSAPDESKRNAAILLCLSTKESQSLTECDKCESILEKIEQLDDAVDRIERSLISEHKKSLWTIPNPQPTDSEYASAFVKRLKALRKWVELFGDPRRLERLVARVHRWLALRGDCHDYKPPIFMSEGDQVDGRFTLEYRIKARRVGCLAELLLKAKDSDDSELLSIIEANRDTYQFTYLEDLRCEYLHHHEKPVEPELMPTDIWCGVCLAFFPKDELLPSGCPKCEADRRKRDVVTKSKSEEPKKDRTLEDGLYPDERCLVWGGRRFDRLTKKMVAILGVFVEAYSKGRPVVSLSAIKIKTKLRFDGSFIKEAFKLNRKGGPLIHDVSKAIEKIADGDYQLIDPLQIEKMPE